MLYFKKSQPAPECLAEEEKKRSGTYRCGEVPTRLRDDFKNKCYICERKSPITINVEHFIPHRGDVALKFWWENLFYACGHCNRIKHDHSIFDDILNCTVDVAIEAKLHYWIKPYPGEKVEIVALDNTTTAQNTQELLMRVFNGNTTLQEMEADNLTEALLEEIFAFQRELIEYFKDTADDEDRAYYRRKIKQELHPASSFTSFKRSIICANSRLLNEFGEYLLQ